MAVQATQKQTPQIDDLLPSVTATVDIKLLPTNSPTALLASTYV